MNGGSIFVKSIMLAAAALAFGASARERQIITAPVTVEAGDTLSVPAGSELLFAPFTGVTVKSGGFLSALGTKKQPVIFTSANDTGGTAAPFDWNGIEIDSGGAAAFEYCLIANAAAGVTAADSGGASLTQCIFSANGQWDLSVAGVIQTAPNVRRPYDYPPRPGPVIPPAPPPGLAIPPLDVKAAPAVPPPFKTSPRRQLMGWVMGGAGAAAAVAGVAYLLHAAEFSGSGADAAAKGEPAGGPTSLPIPGDNEYQDGLAIRQLSTQSQPQTSDDWRKKRGTAQTIGLSFLGVAAVNAVLLIVVF